MFAELGDCGGRIDEFTPLPGKVGALQKHMTANSKKLSKERESIAKMKSEQEGFAEGYGFAEGFTEEGFTEKGFTEEGFAEKGFTGEGGYALKNLKNKAWHKAVSAAEADGYSHKEALEVGRAASAPLA